MGFFTKQRYDYAGMLAVRLQKFIIFLFFLSLVWFGLHVHSMVQHGQFYAAPFIGANLSWLIMYAGFIGAYRRNTALLMFYFIVSLLGALVLIAGFVVTSVGISLAVLHDCQQTAGCDARAEAPKDVTIITAIVFAFTIVPLLLKVVGAVLALVTRREILISRSEAALKLSLMMEEGIAIPADEVVESTMPGKVVETSEPEVAQQQIQYMPVPMPAFYPPSGQQVDAQAWQPQGFQPMGAYSQQPFVYYYYPAQQQQ
jgi:hypothetical protein